MTKRIDPDVAATRTVGVRLTPSQLAQLDEEVALSNASAVGAQASQASVARALLVEALQARARARSANTTHTKATAAAPSKPAPTPKAPTLPPIENAVFAALKANEKPGTDLLDVAAVVRALEAKGYERTAIQAELVRLGTADVDVIELRPDSGNGNERSDDRAIVPKGLDGTPLLTARLLKRTEPTPPQDHNSDALRARFKAAIAAKKTGPSKAAEFTECSERSIRRWLKGEATMTPDDSAALSAHLASLEA